MSETDREDEASGGEGTLNKSWFTGKLYLSSQYYATSCLSEKKEEAEGERKD